MTVDVRQYAVKASEKRQARLIRDSRPSQWIWLVSWCLPGIPLMALGYLIGGSIIALIGIIGAIRYRNAGVGFMVPLKKWLPGARQKIHEDKKYESGDKPVLHIRPCNYFDVVATQVDDEMGTETVYIRVKGFRFANADIATKFEANRQIGDALKKVISINQKDIRFGWIVGERPYDPRDWAAHTSKYYLHRQFLETPADPTWSPYVNRQSFEASIDKLFSDPDFTISGEQAANIAMDNLEQRWRQVAEEKSEFYSIVYLTLDRPASWKKFDKHLDKPLDSATVQRLTRQLRRSDLMSSLGVIVEGLRNAGFIEPHIMDVDEIQDYCFRLWNVRTHAQALATGYPIDRRANIPNGETKPSQLPTFDISGGADTLRTDGNEHAILINEHFASEELLPDSMYSSYMQHPVFAFTALHAVTTSASRERWLLRRRRAVRNAWYDSKYKGGYDEELQDRVSRQRDADEIDAVWLSGSKAIRFNFVTLVSTSCNDIDEVIEAEQRKQREIGLDAVQLRGRKDVTDGFLSFLGMRT